MSSPQWRCRSCQTPLLARAEYCVLCYARAHAPCPVCMRRGVDGRYRPLKDRRGKAAIDCAHCNNERWVLDVDKLRHYVRGPTDVDK